MSDLHDLDRRQLIAGLAGTALAGVVGPAPSAASTAIQAQPFEVKSSDGVVLRGEARGDVQAPEILLIHGLRQSRLSWVRQMQDTTLKGFRMVSFDLRGHGDSDKPDSPDAYRDAGRWADDIASVIEATKLRRPVLVGWSLGGYVAGGYLSKYGSNKVAGINLVDAVVRLSPDLLTPLAGTFTETTTSPDLSKRTAATAEFLQACFNMPPVGDELEQMLVVNGMTPRAVNEGFVKTQLTDLVPVFGAYRGPILLTHGAHDRLVRLAMSEIVKAVKADAQLSIFQESGHTPFYEQPERYNRELAAFVRSSNAS
ncbi:MAG TPA: alpha/beta hydrolase [Bradyrhizobium sp.]|nr:alpha/beta hydrolase [Bradyrhizobium sp.]